MIARQLRQQHALQAVVENHRTLESQTSQFLRQDIIRELLVDVRLLTSLYIILVLTLK